MANFNFKDRVIECKVVYYGPGRCGKTTNLEHIFKAFRKSTSGDMVSIDTKGDRTLFFDFLPMGLGKIRGCDVMIQLYTVPGQQKYSSTRKMVLKGVDGVVFVADSLEVRRKANLLSLKDLQGNLKEQGHSIFKLPILPEDVLDRDLNSKLKAPFFTASAVKGTGVWPTLKECMKLTLLELQKELKWAG